MDAAAEHDGYADAMRAIAGHFVDAPQIETWRLGASLFADEPVPGGLARQPADAEEDAARN